VRSCGPSPRVSCNEADAVRSACLKGNKMAINIKMKDNIDKIETIKIHKKILNPAENKTIISTSPFFYEKSRLLWFTGISELW